MLVIVALHCDVFAYFASYVKSWQLLCKKTSNFHIHLSPKKEHKGIKKWLKILIIFVVVISSLSFGGYYLLITKPVQNLIGKRILTEISKRTGTSFKASQVSFAHFRELKITDLLIEDQNNDTLLYAYKVVAVMDSLNRSAHYVHLQSLVLTAPIINISQEDSITSNYAFIVDSLSNPDKPDSSRWKVDLQHLKIDRGKFTLALAEQAPLVFNNSMLQANIDEQSIALEQLSFGLNNGFVLEKTHADIYFEDNAVNVPELSIISSNSSLILKNIIAQSPDFLIREAPLDQLKFQLQSNNSSISGRDISFFLPESFAFENDIIIDGKMAGDLQQLRGEDFHIKIDEILDVNGDFEVDDLNDLKKLNFDVELNDLVLKIAQIADFYNKMQPQSPINIAPYAHWKQISYEGNISGINHNFKTKGKVKTPFGILTTDLFVVISDSLQNIEYNGDISTQNFHLGKALQNDKILSDASAQLFVSGGMQPNGKFANYFKGEVSSLSVMDYKYSNIILEGGLGKEYFDGTLNVNDKNAKFDFRGKIDFLSLEPSFNFTLNMDHLSLVELNLIKDYDQLDVSFALDSKLKGNRVDDLNGFLDIYNLSVLTEYDSFVTDSISLSFKPLDALPSIVLSSEYINGLILGSYNFSEILGYLNTSLKKHLKYLPQQFKIPTNTTPNDFSFAFEVDDMQNLAKTLDLPLRANGFSVVSGKINSKENTFELKGDIPYLLTKKQLFDSVAIDVHNNNQLFESDISIQNFTFGGNHVMNNISVSYDIKQDTMLFVTHWDNEKETAYNGDFKANIWLDTYGHDLRTTVEIQPSEFVISDTLWHLNKNRISILPQHITIDSLIFNTPQSYFLLDGIASTELTDTMRFEMEEFDLSNIDRFLNIKNFTFSGILSGYAELYSLLDNPILASNIQIDSMSVNESDWGNLTGVSMWDREKKALNLYVDCESTDTGDNLMSVNGVYHPEVDSLDLEADFDGFDIRFLKPYLERTLSNLKGQAAGHLDVKGAISNPELYGALMVNNGSFGINYLSSNFTLNDSIKFGKERFIFDATKVQDQDGNYGVVTGDVKHTKYKNMLVDIIIESDRFLGLNTTAVENEYFYGDIYFGGVITIQSTLDKTIIGSSAKTMQGSFLTVPLSPVSTANSNNFINYVVKKKTILEDQSLIGLKEVRIPKKDLIIDMNFHVTPAATMRLEFDAQSGDVIEAIGQGNLNIQFQQGQPFQIFGVYEIVRGDYLFTLQQIFNKKFNINSRSTLRWSGKPGDAIMDITAQYPTRASLYNLMPDAIGESNKNRRVPVNVKMMLTDLLSKPHINFDIELPNTDEETQQSVSNIINTEEEMSRQVLSLLIMNSFYTPDYYTDNASSSQTNNQLSSVAAVTASEFLSNQLSNWMSQISNNVDLGFRYIPEQVLTDEGLTPEEYEMAISTQFFDDRITVNGNVGYQNYATEARPPNVNSNFVGEVDVEVKINENVKFKAYSHQNDDILYENSNMKQGAGISYQEDFTTVKELSGRYKQRIGRLFNREKKKDIEMIRKEELDMEEELDDN